MRRIQRVVVRSAVRRLRTPFSTALGSKASINSVFVSILLDDGTCGTGEVPTSFSVPDETVDVIKRVLREAAKDLIQSPIDIYRDKIEDFRRRFPRARMTVSGLEVALFRAHLVSHGNSEFAYWGGLERTLESDITIPFSTDADSVRQWVTRAAASGFRIFKLKVSGVPSKDITFVSLVQSILKDGPTRFELRLDGNQGFARGSLLEFSDMVGKRGITVDLFEQPLPKDDLQGLAYVRDRIPVPIILDESVFSVESLGRAMDSGACGGVNIKVAKSGISESRSMIEIARQKGIRLMVGCMMETMVGLSAAVYLACGMAVFDFVDLDSVHFLYHTRRYGDISVGAPFFTVG